MFNNSNSKRIKNLKKEKNKKIFNNSDILVYENNNNNYHSNNNNNKNINNIYNNKNFSYQKRKSTPNYEKKKPNLLFTINNKDFRQTSKIMLYVNTGPKPSTYANKLLLNSQNVINDYNKSIKINKKNSNNFDY
jgi:hypothetical protein